MEFLTRTILSDLPHGAIDESLSEGNGHGNWDRFGTDVRRSHVKRLNRKGRGYFAVNDQKRYIFQGERNSRSLPIDGPQERDAAACSRNHNPRVGGSNPSSATKTSMIINDLAAAHFVVCVRIPVAHLLHTFNFVSALG